MADRFPEQIDDDEIKKAYKQFYLAAQPLEPKELQESLLMTLHMTHLPELSGSTMFGVAKYPIDKWTEAGEPIYQHYRLD
eukprot:9910651-Prorocentrum_lima.AAC.1